MSSLAYNKISELIEQETNPQELINYFCQLIFLYSSHIENNYLFNEIVYYIKKNNNKKQSIEILDLFYKKLEKFILTCEEKSFKKNIFWTFLTDPSFSNDWNFLEKIPTEEQFIIIYGLLPETKFLSSIEKKQIPLEKYLNQDRIQLDGLNIKEKSLILYLYSGKPYRIHRKKLFNFIQQKFQNLELNIDKILKSLNLGKVYPQNFLALQKDIINQFNEKKHSININKKKTFFSTENAIILNAFKIASKTLVTSGYYYNLVGTRQHNLNKFLNHFMINPELDYAINESVIQKQNKAKTNKNKKFWLELSLEIKNRKKPIFPNKKIVKV